MANRNKSYPEEAQDLNSAANDSSNLSSPSLYNVILGKRKVT